MRIGKSLLLGSAAGIAAVSGAQAADLPVKAKPVEYVKVCSLYGAGFFYIPGTDKCIKIGGLLREQWDIHASGDAFAYWDTTNGSWTRGFTSDSSFRTRGVLTIDIREQASFGTIRGYMAIGAQQTTPNDATSAIFFNRAFVQFAGFTGGRAVSFFDFISFDPFGYSNVRTNLGNTGATGIDVFAYTAQFGNGVSATLSAEDSCAETGTTGAGRKCLVQNVSVANSLAPGAGTTSQAGYLYPEIVGSLRVDQAWGSAQVMGALHRVAANYYGTVGTGAGSQGNGHPGEKLGWAAGGGFLLKDFIGMKGDQFGVQANYAVGAVNYLGSGVGALTGFSGGAGSAGNSIAYNQVLDGVYTSGTAGLDCGLVPGGVAGVTCGSSIELTKGWTVGGIYEHKWNEQWKSSLYGGYIKILYNDTAANYICNGRFAAGWGRGTAPTPAAGTTSPFVPAGGSLTNCEPNTSFWSLGSRTQWNPNSNLDLGVDVMWTHLNTANNGTFNSGSTTYGARPSGVYNLSNYDVITAAIRAQYNFLP